VRPEIRTAIVRVARRSPEFRRILRDELLRLAYSGDFLDSVKGRKFRNPETGREVRFQSLPPDEQQKIYRQWSKGDRGPAEDETAKPSKVHEEVEGELAKARKKIDRKGVFGAIERGAGKIGDAISSVAEKISSSANAVIAAGATIGGIVGGDTMLSISDKLGSAMGFASSPEAAETISGFKGVLLGAFTGGIGGVTALLGSMLGAAALAGAAGVVSDWAKKRRERAEGKTASAVPAKVKQAMLDWFTHFSEDELGLIRSAVKDGKLDREALQKAAVGYVRKVKREAEKRGKEARLILAGA